MKLASIPPLKVHSAELLGPRLLHLALERPPGFNFVPGQYLLIEGQAFAIASPPGAKLLEFFVRLPDSQEHRFRALEPGDWIESRSLDGTGLALMPQVNRIRFIATGTAIASFRSFLLSSDFSESQLMAELWVGFRNEDDLSLLKGLETVSKLTTIAALTRPSENWQGKQGRLLHHLKNLPNAYFREPSLYSICGQFDFVEATKELLLSHGISSTLILDPN